MKKNLFLFVFIIIATPVFAQIQWQTYIGGSASNITKEIHQTTDGGYIISGSTDSNDGDITGNHGSYDAWVVKLSSSGGKEWQKCLGGSSGDYAYCVQQTSDGGFIVGGSTESSDGDVSGVHDYADCWVVKLSATGALIWQKTYGGSFGDEIYSIKETSDGGYIFAGGISSNDGDVTGMHGGTDVWVVKLSVTGSIEWQKAYGGSDIDDENNVSICQTFDGGYVFATSSYSTDGDITANHGRSDFWVVKLSAIGNIEWQKSLGGPDDDYAYSIWQTFDSGYVVTGGTFSFGGDITNHVGGGGPEVEDMWTVKLSPGGSIQWDKCIDRGGFEFGSCVQQTSDTGYIVCGGSDYGLLLVKFTEDGKAEWKTQLRDSWGASVSQTNDGGYILCSDVGEVIKMGSKPSGVPEITNTPTISITPNPTTSELSITSPVTIEDVTIMNIKGQTVYTQKYHTRKVQVNVADLVAGVYTVRINNTDIKQFVKQ